MASQLATGALRRILAIESRGATGLDLPCAANGGSPGVSTIARCDLSTKPMGKIRLMQVMPCDRKFPSEWKRGSMPEKYGFSPFDAPDSIAALAIRRFLLVSSPLNATIMCTIAVESSGSGHGSCCPERWMAPLDSAAGRAAKWADRPIRALTQPFAVQMELIEKMVIEQILATKA